MDEIIKHLNLQTLGVATITVLACSGLIAKSESAPQPPDQRPDRQVNGVTVTEESAQAFAKCRPTALFHGPLLAVIDMGIHLWKGTSSPWVALAIAVGSIE
jgi:hypothetical protein